MTQTMTEQLLDWWDEIAKTKKFPIAIRPTEFYFRLIRTIIIEHGEMKNARAD